MAPTCTPPLPPWPAADFSAYGPVTVETLPRIQALTGSYLTRNWTMIPHVTHHDDVDITELDLFRTAANGGARPEHALTVLPFLMKAMVAAMQSYPRFNASLDASGQQLTLKHYFHIGVAIDTPKGLLVGVVRECDRKGVAQIGAEVGALSAKARSRGLSMEEMSGGCMSVSSLGGIGGTAFTPIINAPELAILGVTRSQWKPRRAADGSVDWRLMMPLSLSYDHRVINGADAARFVCRLGEILAQPAALMGADPEPR